MRMTLRFVVNDGGSWLVAVRLGSKFPICCSVVTGDVTRFFLVMHTVNWFTLS